MEITITRLFEQFAECYGQWQRREILGYLGEYPDYHVATLKRLNSGDCGTAAIAVGWVWEQLTGNKVTYCDNSQHGFIEYYNWCYDTLQPCGARQQHMYGHYVNHPVMRYTDVRTMHHVFLRGDSLGYAMVCEFCGLYGVKPYSLTDFQAAGYRPAEDKIRLEADRIKFAKWKYVSSVNPYQYMPLDTPMLVEIVTQSIPRKDEVFYGYVTVLDGVRTLMINQQPVLDHGTILQYRLLDDLLMSYQHTSTNSTNYGTNKD